MAPSTIPRALTIAGSDSSGGAGIEADLKTFTVLAVYGMAAVTAVTAQDTETVTAVHEVPSEVVAEQIDVVARDIGVDAAKTGMLCGAATIDAVAASIAANNIHKLVVDPVLISTSGTKLLHDDARDVLITKLFPLALLLTPNVPEAETLTRRSIASFQDICDAARALHDMGAQNVLIKGGHIDGPEAIDYLFDGSQFFAYKAPRVQTQDTHGTGCTFSAAITAYLAKGLGLQEAIRHAKRYVTMAIQHSLRLGKGCGPLNHFWKK